MRYTSAWHASSALCVYSAASATARLLALPGPPKRKITPRAEIITTRLKLHARHYRAVKPGSGSDHAIHLLELIRDPACGPRLTATPASGWGGAIMNAHTVTAESRRGLLPAAAVVTAARAASDSVLESCRGLCCRCRCSS
ncbi:hypothetical protein GCM10009839_75960 [Catenulispora yoronensis]|uniref:Secreted protein n=1 Tax=Catenulispora yoronensis TaxID=450799 RepID=A0ABN2V9A5_9ACTN